MSGSNPDAGNNGAPEPVLFGKAPQSEATGGRPDDAGDGPRIPPVRVRIVRGREQPNSALIQGQLQIAQRDRERSHLVRQREEAQHKAKLTLLHDALHPVPAPEPESRWAQSKRGILIGLGGTALVAAVVAAGVWGFSRVPRTDASPPVAAEPAKERVSAPIAEPPKSAFTDGAARLSSAFSRFPGEDPEQIMRAINKKAGNGPKVCSFGWNNGVPVMEFGTGAGQNPSLGDAFTRCADAVEKYR